MPDNSTTVAFRHSPSLPVAVIVGGSTGLGLAVSLAFLNEGYNVFVVARDKGKLEAARTSLTQNLSSDRVQHIHIECCDAMQTSSLVKLFSELAKAYGRLDVLVNCIGQSDRGDIASLSRGRLIELIDANVTATLQTCQAALPLLRQSKGVVVNVGSLAAKVGAKYLGGYCVAKHALAGLTQQMRLEWKAYGVHVALVNPGPIRREDAGNRYKIDDADGNVPAAALKPGGGTTVRGVSPEAVARSILRCVKTRCPDIVVPGYLRLLIAAGHLFPRLGDWLLLKKTPK